jgi:hypothetical protein
MSAIISGLIGGVVATALGALALRTQKTARPDQHGWRRLRPGWLYHLATFGSLVFVVLAGVSIAVGSARADADEQNFYALLLMLGFGGAGAVLVWAVYLRRIEWKGDEIRVTGPFGQLRRYRFSSVEKITENSYSEIKLRMPDGSTLRASPYLNGFFDFMDELVGRCPVKQIDRSRL